MFERSVPSNGYPTRSEQVWVLMNGVWLAAVTGAWQRYADGESYRIWVNWPGGRLDLGDTRPRGCTGSLYDPDEAFPEQPAEAGMLREFGAQAVHLCGRIHHKDVPGLWCWCDRCFEQRSRRSPR